VNLKPGEEKTMAKKNIVPKLKSDDFLFDGFMFDGGFFEPRCEFCQKKYEDIGVQVQFHAGYEICYSCLLKGPKVVATETTHRPAREFHKDSRRWFMHIKGFANKFKTIERFEDMPLGIVAVAIAEGARKIQTGKAA
jgi:hypothetical protein